MYSNYQIIREEKGMKDADVARLTGIRTSTLSEWKTGKHTPSVAKLTLIADALGVPVSRIISGNVGDELNADEKHLVDIFRKMNRSGRATLLSLAESMALNAEYQSGKKLSDSEIA